MNAAIVFHVLFPNAHIFSSLNIANFNDIKEGDIIEGYERVEVKAKL
ncbi:MAG: hypothetical protein ACK417_09240 [Bacteroidia bacterium]